MFAVCGFLLLAVAVVFGQTVWHGFVNYDDDIYVYENHSLERGLTADGLTWALTTVDGNFWHPLTWLSFLIDFQLYGMNPWGYHLTNVLLHAANTVLLFLVLWRMTGRLWPCAFVAALFGIHPLHVESVAWISERKDVLSGLFFMLTLLAYVGYVRHSFSLIRYLAVVLSFALGLMAKPALVTLPFVLLLLDYWPLGRMAAEDSDTVAENRRASIPWRVVIEKIPLFLLTIAFCVATPLAEGNAVTSLEAMPMSWRIANAPVSYVMYLAKFFCPVGLAVPYPHLGGDLPVWAVAGSSLLLLGISVVALVGWRRFPYLFVGWFWYLGMLVPMIGLVQVGTHAMADRYTYLPLVGVCLALAWSSAEVVAVRSIRRQVIASSAAVIVLILMGCAWQQTSYWRNSETLWNHTLACTSQNAVAHTNLANALASRGQRDAAITHFQKAVEAKPNDPECHNNLGLALAGKGQIDEAIAHYQRALQLQPDHVKTHNNLGVALGGLGQLDAAIAHFREASRIEPDLAGSYFNHGIALHEQGKTAAAIVQWREAVRLEPTGYLAINRLAWVLATCPDDSVRNGPKAVELAQRAEQLTHGRDPVVLDTLAAAHAEAGQFSEALEVAHLALAIASGWGNGPLTDGIRARVNLYQAGSPYHETGKQHDK